MTKELRGLLIVIGMFAIVIGIWCVTRPRNHEVVPFHQGMTLGAGQSTILRIPIPDASKTEPVISAIPAADGSAIVEPKYVANLRAAAAKRNVYWFVDCVYETFYGTAVYHHGDERAYQSEGGKPHWFVEGTSQQDAAIKLTRALAGPPNYIPPADNPTDKWKNVDPHHECPSPISGGPEQ